jgi:hypothetical protein
MSACRSCSAEVLWVYFVSSGRRAPLDAEPTPDGRVLLEPDGIHARVVSAQRAMEARAAGEQTYTSHFATCPDKREWRRHRHGRAA